MATANLRRLLVSNHPQKKQINNSKKSIVKNSLLATLGLFFYSFGVYLEIQANIGVAPWDALNLGMVNTFGIMYGTANIIVSFIVLAIDILLRERIGIGMILDALLVGKFVDLFNWLNLIPKQQNPIISISLLIVGMFITGFSQYLYMKASLGCGPRDSLLVGLCRLMNKLPIGAVSVGIMATVTLAGWLLGGPIGLGTLLCAFLTGPIMQFTFKLVRFNATDVEHQDIITSIKIISKKNS